MVHDRAAKHGFAMQVLQPDLFRPHIDVQAAAFVRTAHQPVSRHADQACAQAQQDAVGV
ncbi:hypothetical protein D3C87_1271390 [compost metagenome]